jgi:hypothetical protein
MEGPGNSFSHLAAALEAAYAFLVRQIFIAWNYKRCQTVATGGRVFNLL